MISFAAFLAASFLLAFPFLPLPLPPPPFGGPSFRLCGWGEGSRMGAPRSSRWAPSRIARGSKLTLRGESSRLGTRATSVPVVSPSIRGRPSSIRAPGGVSAPLDDGPLHPAARSCWPGARPLPCGRPERCQFCLRFLGNGRRPLPKALSPSSERAARARSRTLGLSDWPGGDLRRFSGDRSNPDSHPRSP